MGDLVELPLAGQPVQSGSKPAHSRPDPGQAEQQAAVDHRSGPALVLAAPGSGKTWVITQRFAALCREGLGPHEIQALTFARRAAEEMKERVLEELGGSGGEPAIATYDAFAHGVVRKFGWLLGLPPNLRLVDNAETWMHLAEAVREVRHRALFNPTQPYAAVAEVKRVIEAAKKESVSPEDYLAWSEAKIAQADFAEVPILEAHRAVALVYARLVERYRQAQVADYLDMVALAQRLLREHSEVRQHYASIRHLMVDEFQDTNRSQAELIELLAQGRDDVFVVADDDQAIYKFRGASRTNIEWFRGAFPHRTEYRLLSNRRSTPQVVALAQALIEPSHDREPKAMRPVRPDGPLPVLLTAPTWRHESEAVVERCRELLAAGARPSEIAILVRRRTQMVQIIDAMRAAEIPYLVSGGHDFFNQDEVKGLLALLEVIAEPQASVELLRCLRLPSWQITNQGRRAISAALRADDRSLFDRLAAGDIPDLSDEDRDTGLGVAAAIEELHALSQQSDVREVFYSALDLTGFLGVAGAGRTIEQRQVGANLNRFGEILEAFCEADPVQSLGRALEYLHLVREAGGEGIAGIGDQVEGIQLQTMHGAKGLEWPHVLLPGLIESVLPGREQGKWLELPPELVTDKAGLEEDRVEEERRVLYVGATRARDSLFLSWASVYPRTWQGQSEKLTPFLGPVPDQLLEKRSQVFGSVQIPRPRRLPVPIPAHELRLSYSAMRNFKNCPRRYQYRHVFGLPERNTPQSWFGQLLHGVLRQAMDMRRAGGNPPLQEVLAMWTASWGAAAGGYRGRMPELRAEGAELLRIYVESPLWAEARPIENEFGFTLVLPGDAQLEGRFDRVDRIDGGVLVVDYKTGITPREPNLQKDLQAQVYAHAASICFGADLVVVEKHYLGTGTAIGSSFGSADLARAKNRITFILNDILAARQEGIFDARPGPRTCPHCAFWSICDEGRQRLSVGAAGDPAN